MFSASRFRLLFLFPLLALVVALLPIAAARATTTHRADDAPLGHLTVVVLDMSGSMQTNDPNGLRCSAANAYIDLSGSNPSDPTNYVGIVGLVNDNNTGGSGGAHNFRLAESWADPVATNTPENRQSLRTLIQTKSNNCAPNGNTPTYDSLAKAYAMLDATTKTQNLSASVILLTDGNPDPRGDEQVADIKSELLPQFQSRKWPIDTIALGTDTSYRGFLSEVSTATGGTAYDDSQGPVQGVSPLNLERCFVDIFKTYVGRTLKATIPATPLTGTNVAQQFYIGDGVTHLDVVAVKDNPASTISLTDPNGKTFVPDSQGNFLSTDPHYTIFTLEAHAPATAIQNGPWTLNASGSGQFLMDSLIVSTLALSISAPSEGKTLPLGQPIKITATLVDQGNIVVDKVFDVQALVTPASGENGLKVYLKDRDATGTYSATFTLPLDAAVGDYTISGTATLNTVAVEQQVHVKFALFPTPTLLSPQGAPLAVSIPTGCASDANTLDCRPQSAPASATATAWDNPLRFIYANVPFFSSTIIGWHPRDWPLSGYSLDAQAPADGVVLSGSGTDAKPYTGATVTAIATRKSDGKAVPVTVRDLGQGRFRLFFPSGTRGDYLVTLTATGQPQDAFGEPVVVTAPVSVSLGVPSRAAQQRAWLITALYLASLLALFLVVIVSPLNYLVRPKPGGKAQLVDESAKARGSANAIIPLRWRAWTFGRYVAPNRLPAGQAALPNNLAFRFSFGKGVAMRVRRASSKNPVAQWSINGRTITHADGPETLVPGMEIGLSEAGQTRTWKYEQARYRPPKPAKPKTPKQPTQPKPPTSGSGTPQAARQSGAAKSPQQSPLTALRKPTTKP